MADQGLKYAVDVVICIDATGSMHPVIDEVKSRAARFPDDVFRAMDKMGKKITRLRVRVIAYRDVRFDSTPFQVSDFFTVPDQVSDYEAFVRGISADGGGDEPESGLEALAIAINSDWSTDMDRQRHVVMVLTDASAHTLEEGAGHISSDFGAMMPKGLAELTEWWEGGDQTPRTKLKQAAKRLIMFAPEAYPWSDIYNNWSEPLHFPSQAGKGLEDHEYLEVLDSLAKSV